MTTAAYAIKRQIFDFLATKTGTGKELDGVQVEYAYPGQVSDVCVYGGGVVFEQPGTDDVVDGDDVLAHELDTVRLYIRIVGRGLTVRATEEQAEAIGDVIGALLRTNPRLAGPSAYTRIAGGTGDYQNTDDGPIVILAYRVTTAAYV
jgi:hypothetical protein